MSDNEEEPIFTSVDVLDDDSVLVFHCASSLRLERYELDVLIDQLIEAQDKLDEMNAISDTIPAPPPGPSN